MIRPMKDIVLIKPEPTPEKIGNLYVPPGQQYLSHRGTVIAVGPGLHDRRGRFVPTTIQPGDDVLYSPVESAQTRIDGERLVVVREAGVLVVLSDMPAGTVFIG
jgi:chaperonin GroES